MDPRLPDYDPLYDDVVDPPLSDAELADMEREEMLHEERLVCIQCGAPFGPVGAYLPGWRSPAYCGRACKQASRFAPPVL